MQITPSTEVQANLTASFTFGRTGRLVSIKGTLLRVSLPLTLSFCDGKLCVSLSARLDAVHIISYYQRFWWFRPRWSRWWGWGWRWFWGRPRRRFGRIIFLRKFIFNQQNLTLVNVCNMTKNVTTSSTPTPTNTLTISMTPTITLTNSTVPTITTAPTTSTAPTSSTAPGFTLTPASTSVSTAPTMSTTPSQPATSTAPSQPTTSTDPIASLVTVSSAASMG